MDSYNALYRPRLFLIDIKNDFIGVDLIFNAAVLS